MHRLYGVGGLAVGPMEAAFPKAVLHGAVSRDVLKEIIGTDASALAEIEKIVHPLVAADRAQFAETATSDILVFDIPLLFEKGSEDMMDAVVVVSVDEATQRARVLERGDHERGAVRGDQGQADARCGKARARGLCCHDGYACRR